MEDLIGKLVLLTYKHLHGFMTRGPSVLKKTLYYLWLPFYLVMGTKLLPVQLVYSMDQSTICYYFNRPSPLCV